MSELDPITLEILMTKVAATAEEMAITLQRAGRTIYVKETQDFGTGLMNHDGRLFCFPARLGVCNMVDNNGRTVIDAISDLREGDVIMTNHPYQSGGLSTHLPDVHLLRPYFHEGRIICYGWCFVHLADIGGNVPSSISPSNREIFQEGLLIPPVRIVKAGVLDDDLVALLVSNSRTGEENFGDIKAMLAALSVGDRRVREMVAQYGAETLEVASREILGYTEKKARDAFRNLPDGEYVFSDYMDDDFVTSLPVRIRARMHVNDGLIRVDFSGTDPQLLSAYNIASHGRRHSWLTLRFLQYAVTRDPSIALNGGVFNNIEMVIPQGCLLNPVFPAPVGARHATGNRMVDVLNGLLAQADPEFVRAAGSGIIIPVVLAEPADGQGARRVSVIEPMVGGTGGRLGADGVDGRDPSASGMANNPVEMVESSAGVRLIRYGIRQDSGGPGKWRGGMGLELTFSPLADRSQVLGRGMERFRFVPWGLLGGRPGRPSRTLLNWGRPDERELGKIDVVTLDRSDTFTILTPGGGGYGNPFERPAGHVLRDVALGFVSPESAREDYGVVIRDDQVDQEATKRLRAEMHPPASSLFSFGSMRETWEAVFDDELMGRIDVWLSQFSPSERPGVRADLLAPVEGILAQMSDLQIDRLQQARNEIEARVQMH